jgi:CBS domain-containing membrane protein
MSDEHETNPQCVEPTDEDLKAVLRKMKTYVDISIDDLRMIYSLALEHARTRITEAIPVSAVMTREVITIRKDSDLGEASRLLSENRINSLPVVDDAGRVAGIVTEADVLVMAGLTRGHTIREIVGHLLGERATLPREASRVEKFMSAPAITVRPEADVREAAAIMGARRINSLPVVDGEGRVAGIVSRSDIIKAIGSK